MWILEKLNVNAAIGALYTNEVTNATWAPWDRQHPVGDGEQQQSSGNGIRDSTVIATVNLPVPAKYPRNMKLMMIIIDVKRQHNTTNLEQRM